MFRKPGINVCFTLLFIGLFSFQLFSQNYDFWGTSSKGGTDDTGKVINLGAVFRYDPTSSKVSNQHSFRALPSFDHSPWTELLNYGNNVIYGVTGRSGLSTQKPSFIYKYDFKNQKFSVSANLPSSTGNYIMHSLANVNNKLYGITRKSEYIEFDPVLDSLKVRKSKAPLNGGNVTYALSGVKALSGKLYSVSMALVNDSGAIYEYDLTNDTIYKKYSFTSASGYEFQCNLLPSTRGSLFGICKRGGANKKGTLFEYYPSTNTFVNRFDFDSINGTQPVNTLTLDTNGKIYGTTRRGGSGNAGVIFAYDTRTNSMGIIYHIPQNPNNVEYKAMSDVYNGKLIISRYYTQLISGSYYSKSSVNEFDLKSRIMYVANTNVQNTFGRPTKLPNNNYGIVSATRLYEIASTNYGNSNLLASGMALMGYRPENTLTYTRDKFVYGVSKYGGKGGGGTIFKIDPSDSSVINIASFIEKSSSYNPEGAMIEARNRNLYGTTSSDGFTQSNGTIFEVNPKTDEVKIVFRFNETNGRTPISSLIRGEHDDLFGTTIRGGANKSGVIYKFNTKTKKQSIIHEFNYRNYGATNPEGELLLTKENILYGLARYGGKHRSGVIYSFDLKSNKYTEHYVFTKSASKPRGGFVQHSNGKMYAFFAEGDGSVYSERYGGIVCFDPKSKHTYVVGMGTNFGAAPSGNLIEGDNGILYGTTSSISGRTSQLISFNPITNKFKRESFLSAAQRATLIKVPKCTGIKSYSTISDSTCTQYYSPSQFYVWDTTGTYKDTIPNMDGCDSIITVNLYAGRNTFSGVIKDTLCGNVLSPSKKHLWTTSGIYIDTLVNSSGCDSTIELDLIIKQNSVYGYSVNACNQFISPTGKISYERETVYDTLVNSVGCDSILVISVYMVKTDTTVIRRGNKLILKKTANLYQWLDCDNNMSAIPGATSIGYEPSVMGNYAIAFQSLFCPDTSGCHPLFWTSQNEYFNAGSVSIFPNPSNSGLLNVVVPTVKHQNVEIKIYDVYGKRIEFKTSLNQGNGAPIQIETQNLSGVYFISISFGETSVIRRIMINQ